MSFTVNVEIKRSFDVPCPFDKVFDVLADVPRSVSHFPNMERLVDLGDNTFRWEMAKLGIDKYYFQTVYACKYTDDRSGGWVKWEPIKGVGNGIVKGSWSMEALNDDETRIDFYTMGDLTLPLSSLVKFLVSPFVVREFNAQVDTYIENLKKTFHSL